MQGAKQERRIYDEITEQMIAIMGATTRRERRALHRQVLRATEKSTRELRRAQCLIARDEAGTRAERREVAV